MIIRKHFEGGFGKLETNVEPSLTEKAGYVSAQQRIENMMIAGQRLVQSRIDQFDSTDNQTDEEIMKSFDPLRSPSVDMAEISQMQIMLDEKARMANEMASEAVLSPSGDSIADKDTNALSAKKDTPETV